MKKALPWFITILVLFIAAYFLFRNTSCNSTTVKRPIGIVPSSTIKNEVIKIDTSTKRSFDSALTVIDQYKATIQELKKDRHSLAVTAKQQANDISTLLDQLNSDSIKHSENEYEGGQALQNQFSDYVAKNQAMDSICDETIAMYDSTLQNKNVQIFGLQQQTMNMGRSLGNALENQDKLDQYSKDLRKALNKKKAANWGWKAAVAALAALFIIKH